jgi:pyrroloquinoline quinone biosynthesis protein B
MHDTTQTDPNRSTGILVLGAGQDGGSPQLGHRRGVGPDRTASSVAVVSPLGSIVLLDASPDLREQSLCLQDWSGYPNGRRSLVDAVAITHGHMGHYAGLLHFGRESADAEGVKLIATPSFVGFLKANEPWNALIANGNLTPSILDKRVSIDASMDIVGIPVPHRAEYTDTVGLSVIVDGEALVLYLPDIDGWEEWPAAHPTIAAHRVSIIDATFTDPSELGARDYRTVRHPLVPDSIARFRDLTETHTIVLGHINHTNPLADPASDIARSASDAGFVVARDGLDMWL